MIDEAALAAARDADLLLSAALARGSVRWEEFLSPLPGQLRDVGLRDLRKVAMRARAAYGPKDSIREALPPELTEPFLIDLDRLLKAIARETMEGRL
jgi:hypothetical protein